MWCFASRTYRRIDPDRIQSLFHLAHTIESAYWTCVTLRYFNLALFRCTSNCTPDSLDSSNDSSGAWMGQEVFWLSLKGKVRKWSLVSYKQSQNGSGCTLPKGSLALGFFAHSWVSMNPRLSMFLSDRRQKSLLECISLHGRVVSCEFLNFKHIQTSIVA